MRGGSVMYARENLKPEYINSEDEIEMLVTELKLLKINIRCVYKPPINTSFHLNKLFFYQI